MIGIAQRKAKKEMQLCLVGLCLRGSDGIASSLAHERIRALVGGYYKIKIMEKYKYYLQDLVALLKKKLEEAKQREFEEVGDQFEKGLIMGFYETLDLIKQQAIAFEIPLDEIGISNYPLEDFL